MPAPLTYLIVFLFLSDWRPALNLAALDCADETNNAVCRDFNIPGFPTVRVRERERRAGVGLAGVVLPVAPCFPGIGAPWGPLMFLGLICLNHSPWSTAPVFDETPVVEAEGGCALGGSFGLACSALYKGRGCGRGG